MIHEGTERDAAENNAHRQTCLWALGKHVWVLGKQQRKGISLAKEEDAQL